MAYGPLAQMRLYVRAHRPSRRRAAVVIRTVAFDFAFAVSLCSQTSSIWNSSHLQFLARPLQGRRRSSSRKMLPPWKPPDRAEAPPPGFLHAVLL